MSHSWSLTKVELYKQCLILRDVIIQSFLLCISKENHQCCSLNKYHLCHQFKQKWNEIGNRQNYQLGMGKSYKTVGSVYIGWLLHSLWFQITSQVSYPLGPWVYIRWLLASTSIMKYIDQIILILTVLGSTLWWWVH